jgi:hypothetical protein
MNTNEIDSLIVEAFLRKIDLPDVEAWIRKQAQNDSIVIDEVYCIRVILDWMMDKSPEERESQI